MMTSVPLSTPTDILERGTVLLTLIHQASQAVALTPPRLVELIDRRIQRKLEQSSRAIHKETETYDAAINGFINKLHGTHSATGKDSILIRLSPLSQQQETVHTGLRDLRDQIIRRDQELNSRSSFLVALISAAVGFAALFMTIQQIRMAVQADAEMKRITDKFDQRMEIQIGTMKDLNDRLKEQNALTAKLDGAIERQLGIVEKQDALTRSVLAQKPKPFFLMLLDRKPGQVPANQEATAFELNVILSNSGDRAIEGTIYYHLLIPESLTIGHATGHLMSSSRRTRTVKDKKYHEVAGAINAPVFAGQKLSVGQLHVLGPYQSYTVLSSISIKEGTFPGGNGYRAYSMWFAPNGTALTSPAPDVIP